MKVALFNPTCDMAIANGVPNWQPNQLLQKMEYDLATLPLFFFLEGGVIITPTLPQKAYFEHLALVNIKNIQFVQSINDIYPNELQNVTFQPWGWSPNVATKFDDHDLQFNNWLLTEFNQSTKRIFSRHFSKIILEQFIHTQSENDTFISIEHLPITLTSVNEIESVLEKWEKILLKVPWSSSGRGLIFLDSKKEIHTKVYEKIASIIQKQGSIMCEPAHHKILDVGLEFKIGNGKIQYLGRNYFTTDHKGQYGGSYLKSYPEHIDKKVIEFVESKLDNIVGKLKQLLQNSKLIDSYKGFFGVDLLVYTDLGGKIKINPCLEINLRSTMGHLALQLEKLLDEGAQGIFKTYYHPKESFYHFSEKMKKSYPLVTKDFKIEEGYLPLNYYNEDTKFGAYLLVTKNIE